MFMDQLGVKEDLLMCNADVFMDLTQFGEARH